MSIIGSVKVNSHPVAEILRRKGLDMNGDVQQFHTANVLRRIVRYMPYRTGATIKLTQAQSPISRPEINSFVPYARYLHEGKVMVNAVTGNGPMLIPGIGPRWRRGTQLEQEYATRLPVGDYLPNLDTLHKDSSLPPLADNLVFLDKAGDMDTIDRDILYSILDKDPKRAAAYWFISMNVTDEPDTRRYSVETYGTDYIFRVRLDLGFKCHQRVNVCLRQIVRDLIESGELPPQERKYSIYGKSDVGSFKFVFLHKAVPSKSELSFLDELVLNTKYAIRRVAGSKVRWYGLDTSSLVVETVPFIVGGKAPRSSRLERVK